MRKCPVCKARLPTNYPLIHRFPSGKIELTLRQCRRCGRWGLAVESDGLAWLQVAEKVFLFEEAADAECD